MRMASIGDKPVTPSLIDLLRSTLQHLEQLEGLSPSDPALGEVKKSILRSIAELESSREGTRYAA